MSSRALKKLHGNQDLNIINDDHNSDEDEENELETHHKTSNKKKKKKLCNPFLAVNYLVSNTLHLTSTHTVANLGLYIVYAIAKSVPFTFSRVFISVEMGAFR